LQLEQTLLSPPFPSMQTMQLPLAS